MENIFENAYFGKAYKTRDERKAIYINESTIDKGAVLIVYEDSLSTHRIMKDGHYWATPNIESGNDIVSEWQEEINEVELEKIALEAVPRSYPFDMTDVAEPKREAFKAGYRKAKEK